MARSIIETRRRNNLAEFARGAVLAVRFLWRWHSGYPLNGKFKTDATWGKPATKVTHPSGYASRWHWMHWRRRGMYRSAATYYTLAALYGCLAGSVLALTAVSLVAAAALVFWAKKGWTYVCTWKQERHEIRPLKARLKHLIGREPESITIVREDNPAVTDWRELRILSVEIEWPEYDEIGPRDQPLILEAITDRLALEAPEMAGQKFRNRNRVTRYVQSMPPPGLIGWEHVAPHVEAAGRNELVFGLGKPALGSRENYAVVKASMSTDSPHLACSGGSGGGKSNLGAVIILQELHRGSILFNIDPRWDSHLWAEGLPNVVSVHEIPAVHAALEWLGAELDRRYRATFYASRGRTPNRRGVGPRILVNCEELNFGMQDLKDYYVELRAGDKSMPKRSPALKALQACSCAGRAVDIHLMLWAQMLTVESTGVKDSTVRTNAGIKAMVRYDANNWNMQVGKRFPMPPEPTEPGRIQLVTARGVQETQVPYLGLDQDSEEGEKAVTWAREYAVSGTVAALPTGQYGIPEGLWPVPVAEPVTNVPDNEKLAITAGQDAEVRDSPGVAPVLRLLRPRLVTGPEAIEQGLLPNFDSWESARKALQRDTGAPQPTGTKRGNAPHYDQGELTGWHDKKYGPQSERRDA